MERSCRTPQKQKQLERSERIEVRERKKVDKEGTDKATINKEDEKEQIVEEERERERRKKWRRINDAAQETTRGAPDVCEVIHREESARRERERER